MEPRFVHLHLHSEFSLVDSTIRIGELVKRCASAGMPALALTDQSNLFALVKFYRAAEKAGVKPIIGADVWIDDPGCKKPARLTLLCQNLDGYRHLSELLSRGYRDGHHGEYVTILPEWLRQAQAGLIALAGQKSDVGQCLLESRTDEAGLRLAAWQRDFGDRFYLELTRTGREGEGDFELAALKLAHALDCPVVATNDVRFLDRDDFDAHEARVCIATSRVLADPRRERDYTPEQYFKSPEDMVELFADLPGVLENSVEIARRCTLELSFGTYYLPLFPVPEGQTLDSWIGEESRRGLADRLDGYAIPAGNTRENYEKRLETELAVICRMGFPGYFLIVADFINWAKRNDIPVGPGRGSGAGSLVAWALRITDIDPLPYGLLFERFLNPERVSMPDFDIDFCMDKRDLVIEYVAGKYGRDHVSQIITYGTMAAKAAVRDCGRVLSLSYGFVDGIAKLIPNVLGIGLEDALGRTEKSRENADLRSPDLIQRYESEDDVHDLIDLALKLEDLTRNAGKHAGGVVIGPKPLTEFSPLFYEPPSKIEGQSRGVVTQFDKDDVEAVGLVKFDFLGLRTLTIIDWAVKAINRERARCGETPLDIARISLTDKATYELFAQARTVAVFQFESGGMQRLLKDARPDRFEDLIALVSLYRPGPMDLIPSFCKRKHGEEPIIYPDPRVESVLKETYGIMVYQEQVMQMAQIVGGYSLGGADLLRRAMGKKKPEEMAKERAKFRTGAAANGLDEFKADEIFDVMEKFAGYGFNKSHAAAYALVSYQTAWLKAHYPAQFMAAVLSSDMDNTDKVVTFLTECRAMGLSVLPPDVNASDYTFQAVDSRTLRYGLGAIKGAGEGACREIARIREEEGAYRDLFDFCQRLGQKVNRRVHETLIAAGAVDGLGVNRATMKAQLPDMLRATEQMARDRAAGQVDMFGNSTVETPILPVFEPLPEWPLIERLNGERETLGHYLSGHPIDPLREYVAGLITCTLDGVDAAFEQRRFMRGNDALVLLAGQVIAVNRRNEDRVFVALEDGHGRIEATVYADALREIADSALQSGAFLLIEGQLHEDRFRGGTGLRLRRAWEIASYCTEYGQRLRLTLDATVPGVDAALRETLAPCLDGPAPLTLEILTADARGIIDTDASIRVHTAPALIEALRALPGISRVALKLARPATAAPREREHA
ncbi:DNA polymerase III subunit alpha [Xanthomonadaceae bacterium JHOS43]|nr:DNA polymerase III subunit alpha [Xanthomonadaceae bacterium JHOS43]